MWALRAQALVVVAHGLICPMACGIFPDQGSNPCPLLVKDILGRRTDVIESWEGGLGHWKGHHFKDSLPVPCSHHHPRCFSPTSGLVLSHPGKCSVLLSALFSPVLTSLCSHIDLSPGLILSLSTKIFPSSLLLLIKSVSLAFSSDLPCFIQSQYPFPALSHIPFHGLLFFCAVKA